MEEKKVSIKLNMIMNILLTMSNFIFPLITFPYVSRVLSPVGTGKVTFATSVVSYFGMFVQLGIPVYGVRLCAKIKNNKTELSRAVHELLFINLVMSLVVYLVYGISIFYIPKFHKELKLFIVMGATIILNSLGVEWLYKGLEKYTYITIRSIFFKIIAFAAMFILIRKQSDYVIYGAITIFAASASNILNFINLRKYIYFKYVGGYNFKRHIKEVLVFFAMSISITIYTNLDNVMLGFMKNDEEVGLYGAAVKIRTILLSVVTSASTVLLPRASYYVDKGLFDDFYRVLKKTMHFMILISLPLTVYFIIFAKESILFLSGKDFLGATSSMQIIMPTLLIVGISNITGIQMMVPLGKEKQVLYSTIFGATVDLIINSFLIPIFAAAGAAIGTLFAEIAVLIWQWIAIKEIKFNLFEDVKWSKIIFAIVLAVIISILFKIITLHLFVKLLLSAIAFFGLYFIIMLILNDSILKELVCGLRKHFR